MPFKYTAQNTQPDELLARATSYTGGNIAGLNTTDFALLKEWYQHNPEDLTYRSVNTTDLQNYLLAKQTQQDLRQMNFTPLTGVKIASAGTLPALRTTMPDIISLRIPDENGKPAPLPVVQNQHAQNPACNFYQIVTDKEITWFIKQYSRELNSIVRKNHARRKLTQKEKRIQRWKEQLLENKHKTEICREELAH